MKYDSNTFKTFVSDSSLKSACSKCQGFIKICDNCGTKIEVLNGRPLNYHEGSIHRCGRGSKLPEIRRSKNSESGKWIGKYKTQMVDLIVRSSNEIMK